MPAAISEFLAWTQKSCAYSVGSFASEMSRREFVPLSTLETYLEDSRNTRLKNILTEVFRPDNPPIYPEVILKRYTAVFCTLLELGKGRYIEYFTQHDSLCDVMLPFDLNNRPSNFPVDTNDSNFFRAFCRRQWKFCAPTFQYPMQHLYFENERVLPIVSRELLGKSGGSAVLHKIRVHQAYNRLEPRDGNPVSRISCVITNKNEAAKTKPRNLVLKTIPSSSKLTLVKPTNSIMKK
jgi:hypothetical protein